MICRRCASGDNAGHSIEWSYNMPPLMQSNGGASRDSGSTGGVVKTAKASPRQRTVCRSSGGVRGSDRRKATKRSRAVDNSVSGRTSAPEPRRWTEGLQRGGSTAMHEGRRMTGSRTERSSTEYYRPDRLEVRGGGEARASQSNAWARVIRPSCEVAHCAVMARRAQRSRMTRRVMSLRVRFALATGEVFVVPSDGADLLSLVSDVAERACQVDWRIHDVTVMPVAHIQSTTPPRQHLRCATAALPQGGALRTRAVELTAACTRRRRRDAARACRRSQGAAARTGPRCCAASSSDCRAHRRQCPAR